MNRVTEDEPLNKGMATGGAGGSYCVYDALHPEELVEEALLEDFSFTEPGQGASCYERSRYQVKVTLDDPQHSSCSHAVQYFVIGCILGSTTSAVVETVPDIEAKYLYVFVVLERMFTGLFTIEILLRLWISDSISEYLCTWMMLVDFLAVLPWYVEQSMAYGRDHLSIAGLTFQSNEIKFGDEFWSLRMVRMVRMVRLMRVLRLAKAARHSEVITTVLGSIHDSMHGLVALVVFTCMGTLFSATVVFFLECEEEGTAFVSIPASVWWALPTLTGVGYGDILPRTPYGRLAGLLTMIGGILITSVCTALITTSFIEQFQRNMQALRMERLTTKHKRAFVRMNTKEVCKPEDKDKKTYASVTATLKEVEGSITDVLNILDGLATMTVIPDPVESKNEELPNLTRRRSQRYEMNAYASVEILREQSKTWVRHVQQLSERLMSQAVEERENYLNRGGPKCLLSGDSSPCLETQIMNLAVG